MAFNAYLIGIITFLTLLVPFIGIYGFIRGYALGAKDFNASHDDIQKGLPETQKKHKVPSPDPDLEKYRIILENIENYDGTDAHQKEIN